jgi:hypothetical protein
MWIFTSFSALPRRVAGRVAISDNLDKIAQISVYGKQLQQKNLAA